MYVREKQTATVVSTKQPDSVSNIFSHMKKENLINNEILKTVVTGVICLRIIYYTAGKCIMVASVTHTSRGFMKNSVTDV